MFPMKYLKNYRKVCKNLKDERIIQSLQQSIYYKNNIRKILLFKND